MKNWVIIFVRSGSEQKVLQLVKTDENAFDFVPFLPTKESSFRNKGTITK